MIYKRILDKATKANLRTKMIVSEFWYKWKDYGLKYAYYSSIYWIGWYTPLKKLLYIGHEGKTAFMEEYFEYNYASVISDYSSRNQSTEHVDEYRIFLFWWQGYESMPPLVKACYHQLKHIEGEAVILLTKDNIFDYVDIPTYIYQRFKNGGISITHFSDVLRLSLLAKYGGMWIDSTCWVPHKLSSSIKNMAFITPNTKNAPNLPMWSNSKWCGWNIGTSLKNEICICFTRDILYEMYKKDMYLIDYVVMDYILYYAYTHFEEVTKTIDAVPEYSKNRNALWFKMNDKFNQEEYNKIINGCNIFKLSYKTPLYEYVGGDKTYYGYILESTIK